MAWETDLLHAIGAPDYAAGVEALDLWAQSEGVDPAYLNPLASGTPWAGSHAINAAGVQAYPSEAAMVGAYAYSLTHDPYTAIAGALRAGENLVVLWKVVNASQWCSGCQTGHYPVALWTAAGRPTHATPTGSPAVTPTPTPAPSSGTPHQANLSASWATMQDDAGSRAAALRGRMIGLVTAIRRA